MIFEELKKGFQSSIRDHTIDMDKIRDIQTLMLITDNYDDIEERQKSVERISLKLSTKFAKILLYDMASLLLSEHLEKSWIIEELNVHFLNIHSFKERGFDVLLASSISEFLTELRAKKGSFEKNLETFTVDEIDELADFFSSTVVREQDFISSISSIINVRIPELLFWKPPFLIHRVKDASISLQNYSLNLIKELSPNIWIFLEGNRKLDEIRNALGLIFGGQGENELDMMIYGIKSIFSKLHKPALSFLVHIDSYEFNLAKMIAQNTIEKFESKTEPLVDEKKVVTLNDKLVQTLLSEKYNSMINHLRIDGDAMDQTISFGDLHVLQSLIRTKMPDCLLLPMKKDNEAQFIDRIITKANLALSLGISVIIV